MFIPVANIRCYYILSNNNVFYTEQLLSYFIMRKPKFISGPRLIRYFDKIQNQAITICERKSGKKK